MAQYDDMNVRRIATVGVISVIVVAVTALAVQVLYYAMAERTDRAKAAASEYRRQRVTLQQQTEEITSFGVDPQSGNVTIPVDAAVERLLAGDDNQSNNETGSNTDET